MNFYRKGAMDKVVENGLVAVSTRGGFECDSNNDANISNVWGEGWVSLKRWTFQMN